MGKRTLAHLLKSSENRNRANFDLLLTSVVDINDNPLWRKGTMLQSIPILSLPLIPNFKV